MAFHSAAMPIASLQCVLAKDCHTALKDNTADVHVISADQITAAHHPLMIEVRSTPNYAIALVRRHGRLDASVTLNAVQSGRIGVCSAGYDTFSGWRAPDAVLRKLSLPTPSACRREMQWAKMMAVSAVS